MSEAGLVHTMSFKTARVSGKKLPHRTRKHNPYRPRKRTTETSNVLATCRLSLYCKHDFSKPRTKPFQCQPDKEAGVEAAESLKTLVPSDGKPCATPSTVASGASY